MFETLRNWFRLSPRQKSITGQFEEIVDTGAQSRGITREQFLAELSPTPEQGEFLENCNQYSCLSRLEMSAYRRGHIPQRMTHLTRCKLCQLLLKIVEEDPQSSYEDYDKEKEWLRYEHQEELSSSDVHCFDRTEFQKPPIDLPPARLIHLTRCQLCAMTHELYFPKTNNQS